LAACQPNPWVTLNQEAISERKKGGEQALKKTLETLNYAKKNFPAEDPRLATAWINLATLWLDQEKWTEATEALGEATKLRRPRKHSHPHEWLSVIEYHIQIAENIDDSRSLAEWKGEMAQLFAQTKKHGPAHREALLDYIHTLRLVGNLGEAESALRELEAFPKLGDADKAAYVIEKSWVEALRGLGVLAHQNLDSFVNSPSWNHLFSVQKAQFLDEWALMHVHSNNPEQAEVKWQQALPLLSISKDEEKEMAIRIVESLIRLYKVHSLERNVAILEAQLELWKRRP
jgi:tetratricopeptide (TPR) repeat protein